MANINNFNNHPGATFTDKSVTINAQRNNTQFNTENQICGQDEDNHTKSSVLSSIHLNPQTGCKIDLFRVILALQKTGFFVDINGNQATQKAVFEAFGTMLGENFSKFQNHLSEAAKHNNDSNVSTAVFDILSAAFVKYESSIRNK